MQVSKKLGQESVDSSSSASADDFRCSQCILSEESSSVSFTVLKGATNRGKDLLADSLGYTYIRDKLSLEGCRWRCTIRNKHLTCCGSVQQIGFDPGHFTAGPQKHKCQPKDHASITKKQIRFEVKKQALERPYTSASTIVNEVMQSHTDPEVSTIMLPSKATLARTANKYRQGYRRAHAPPQRTSVRGVKKSVKSVGKKARKVPANGVERVCNTLASHPSVEHHEHQQQHPQPQQQPQAQQQPQPKVLHPSLLQPSQIQNPHVPRPIFHMHPHHYKYPYANNTNY